MKWFYNLSKKMRLVVFLVSMIPFGVIVFIDSKVLGVTTQDDLTWYYLLLFGSLVPAIFFCICMAKAEKADKAAALAEQERIAAEQKAKANAARKNAPRSLDEIHTENQVLMEKLNALGEQISEQERIGKAGGKMMSQKELKALGDELQSVQSRIAELKIEAESATPSESKPEFSIRFHPGNIKFPIHTKAKGVTYENRQEHLKESEEGDILIVRHAPLPEFPNAIEIVNQRTGKQLGYIGSDLAHTLIDEFGEGCSFNSEITVLTGGSDDRATLGCNLIIYGVAD